MPTAILISGGLDSAVLLARELAKGKSVVPIYVAQGLLWENVELAALRRFLKAIRGPAPVVFHMPIEDIYGHHWSRGGGHVPGAASEDSAVYLPGRNLLLSVQAAVYCAMKKIPKIVMGSLDHNPFPDATPAFFRLWSKALSKGLGTSLQVQAPFRNIEKATLIRRYAHFPLHLSFSCIAPRKVIHCGHCNKCAERRRAFQKAGVKDNTRYAKR